MVGNTELSTVFADGHRDRLRQRVPLCIRGTRNPCDGDSSSPVFYTVWNPAAEGTPGLSAGCEGLCSRAASLCLLAGAAGEQLHSRVRGAAAGGVQRAGNHRLTPGVLSVSAA